MPQPGIGSVRHQVLVGLALHGPFTVHLHHSATTLDFYRAMAADGLATEVDLGKGGSQFTITEAARVRAMELSDALYRRMNGCDPPQPAEVRVGLVRSLLDGMGAK